MKEDQDFHKKQTRCTVLFSIWLVLTAIGGIVLYILGAAQHEVLYKQIAIISFSVYFVTLGGYFAAKHSKVCILMLVLAAALLLTLFFL